MEPVDPRMAIFFICDTSSALKHNSKIATIHPLDEYVPEEDGGDVWILAAAVVTAMVVTGVVCGRRE